MKLFIYGAGGFGREIAWLVAELNRQNPTGGDDAIDLLGFIDDHPAGLPVDGLRVFDLSSAAEQFPAASVFVAVGSSSLREELVGRSTEAGLTFAPPLVAPSVRMSPTSRIGTGSCLCEGSIVTVDVTIGAHVQVNLDCTLGHDAILDDYVTLAPGVHVSGWVHVRRGAYIGTGANIINGTAEEPLVIGEGAVVGAGACVIADVVPRSTVVGVPAKAKSGS